MGSEWESKDPRTAGVLHRETLVVIMRILSLVREESGLADLLSEPKIKRYRKRIPSLWLQKCMFWVSEQRLVDQANTIRRNSWMTELEIEELERKITGSDSIIAAERKC